MLSRSTTRAIVIAPTDLDPYTEARYYTGDNGADIVTWAHNPDSVFLDAEGHLRAMIQNSCLDRVVEPDSYIVHTRGVVGTGASYFWFHIAGRRLANRTYQQAGLKPRGHRLPLRTAWTNDHTLTAGLPASR